MTADVVPIKRFSAARAKRLQGEPLDGLFASDMAKSGISLAAARKLRIRLVDMEQAWDLLYPKRKGDRRPDFTAEGYWVPYWNADGTQMNYGRMRKLRGNWGAGADESMRYRNPVNTLPHLYVPAPLIDWGADGATGKFALTGSLTITEGEKKAIRAALCGIACVSVGGVTSQGAGRHGLALVQEFDWFNWSELDVKVCLDSDAYEKKSVSQAMFVLSYTVRREKQPKTLKHKRLTTEQADKTALDEYLAAFATPESARRAYEQLPEVSDERGEAFAKFDSELVQVRKKIKYYNVATRVFYPHQRGVAEEYGVGATVLDADGKKRVLPINPWFSERSKSTTTVTDVVYTPGKPTRFLAHAQDEFDTLNEWRPTDLAPAPFKKLETLRPWLDFIEYISPGLTPEQRDWFMDWQAYPLQNLGAKARQAVLIWSEVNGTGKNTVANILAPAYGPSNVMELDGTSLNSKYNDWTQRQFVVINEVHMPSYAERSAVMERLKTLITQDTIDLDRKFLPRDNVKNHLHLLLTSNHADALLLTEDDRRFFVIKGPGRKGKWSDQQFKEFYNWLDNGGRERVFGFLLARNLGNFNPNAAPPRTVARNEMVKGGGNVLSDLMQLLEDDPLKIVATRRKEGVPSTAPDFELFTPMRIIERLSVHAQTFSIRLPPLTVRMVGTELGKRKIPKGEFEVAGQKVTVYAVLNRDRWKQSTRKEWREHFVQYNGKGGDKP